MGVKGGPGRRETEPQGLNCRLSSRLGHEAERLCFNFIATMVSVTVSPAGKPISIARGLPSQFDIPGKEVHDTTIGDVKVAIAKKFPKVSPSLVSILA